MVAASSTLASTWRRIERSRTILPISPTLVSRTMPGTASTATSASWPAATRAASTSRIEASTRRVDTSATLMIFASIQTLSPTSQRSPFRLGM